MTCWSRRRSGQWRSGQWRSSSLRGLVASGTRYGGNGKTSQNIRCLRLDFSDFDKESVFFIR